MVSIISAIIIFLLLFFAALQVFRNRKASGYVDVRSTVMPRLYFVLALMFSCDRMCGMPDPSRLLSDSMIAVVSVTPMILSIRPAGRLPFCYGHIPVIIPAVSLYYILCASGVLELPGALFFRVFSVLTASFSSGFFMWMIWRKLRDVKSVMKSGNSWSFVTLCVDFIYVICPLMFVSLLYPVHVFLPEVSSFAVLTVVILVTLEVVAVSVRILYDSAFVILHDHERIIVESMKISHMDMSLPMDPKGDSNYKELYERIVLYFEMSKPYLDGDLTINDVVKEVYSNKVYISKAICHYTGRNFRQFVNYYRVIHSMELFRANLEMKVAELAEKSGFNTVVSYTMAFRLFMNETPSEWCRKERAKILKPKK